MTNPSAPRTTPPPSEAELGMASSFVDLLIPLFRSKAVDGQAARNIALSAISGYCPETRADFVNAARTVAFSMATLALLGKAAAEDLSLTEKMRILGRANTLNRSADQAERAMMLRRRYHRANPPQSAPHTGPKQVTPVQPNPVQPNPVQATPLQATPDRSTEDAAVKAAVTLAIDEFLANRPPIEPIQATPKPPTPGAGPAHSIAAASLSAIQAARPDPTPAAPYKSTLLSQTALHHGQMQPGHHRAAAATMAPTLPSAAARAATAAQSTSAANLAR